METSGWNCRSLRRSLSLVSRPFCFCLGPAQSCAYRKCPAIYTTASSQHPPVATFPMKAERLLVKVNTLPFAVTRDLSEEGNFLWDRHYKDRYAPLGPVSEFHDVLPAITQDHWQASNRFLVGRFKPNGSYL